MKIHKLVITGPSCSGKTTVCKLLSEKYKDIIELVPETSSLLINHGLFQRPKDERLLVSFQKKLYDISSSIEEMAMINAIQNNKKILLYDRGTPDTAAYMPGGVNNFEIICNTSIDKEIQKYDTVIFFPYLTQEEYEVNKYNNPARFETYQEILDTSDKLLSDIWSRYSKLIKVEGTLTDKVNIVSSIIELKLEHDI